MGCCGSKQGKVSYEVTFKHDGSKVVLPSLPEVRIALAASPQGGSYRAVPKTE